MGTPRPLTPPPRSLRAPCTQPCGDSPRPLRAALREDSPRPSRNRGMGRLSPAPAAPRMPQHNPCKDPPHPLHAPARPCMLLHAPARPLHAPPRPLRGTSTPPPRPLHPALVGGALPALSPALSDAPGAATVWPGFWGSRGRLSVRLAHPDRCAHSPARPQGPPLSLLLRTCLRCALAWFSSYFLCLGFIEFLGPMGLYLSTNSGKCGHYFLELFFVFLACSLGLR